MKYSSSLITGLVVTVFLAGLFVSFPAFAQLGQEAGTWTCSDAGKINAIFCGITNQFRFMPKLLSIFAYAIAMMLFVSALLQLKQYGDDPSKVPLNSVIVKFVIAVMLISLPYATQVFVTTVTGAESMGTAGSQVSKPSLGAGVSGK